MHNASGSARAYARSYGGYGVCGASGGSGANTYLANAARGAPAGGTLTLTQIIGANHTDTINLISGNDDGRRLRVARKAHRNQSGHGGGLTRS